MLRVSEPPAFSRTSSFCSEMTPACTKDDTTKTKDDRVSPSPADSGAKFVPFEPNSKKKNKRKGMGQKKGGVYLVVLSDKVELLVGLLQEEDDVGQDDDRHQLDLAAGVVQIGHALEPAEPHPQNVPSTLNVKPKRKRNKRT